VAIVTFLAGFAVLLYLAYRIHAEPPPIPGRVVAEDGSTLFTGNDIMAGQHIFQKHGLMQYGTIFGHGAYLGPDFTAQYLHEAAGAMVDFHRGQGRAEAEAHELTSNELKHNRFDPQSDALHYTTSQTHAFHQLSNFYTRYFGPVTEQTGLRRPAITDGDEIHRLTAYFAWSAWAAAATRPGTAYSYTNNWPSEPMGGLQLYDAVRHGYWHARQPEFFQQPWSRIIERLRMPGDLIFLFVGILPVVYLALRMFAARRRYARLSAKTTTEEFTQWYEEA
jgi:nitric oxide reductase subunit B